MSVIQRSPHPVNPSKPRPKSPRPKPIARPRLILAPEEGLPGLFSVTDAKGTDYYQLTPIGSAWGTAFAVEKMSTEELLPVYHTLIDTDRGEHSCECAGHLRWGHKTVCRHIAALTGFLALGLLPAATTAPTVSAYPECIGDEAVDHFEEPMPF